MFSEILKIIPVLDPARTKQMEQTLSGRFTRVAKMFGNGLKNAIKGSIIGISLGLLQKLLNPIEELETKIKTLLGEGEDLRDMADKFGTSAGSLKKLQDVGQAIGVKPDQMKEMLTKFQESINKAKTELQDPFAVRSESTRAVENFVGEKDMVKGLLGFLQGLKGVGTGGGHDVFFGEKEQQRAALRQRTGEKLSEAERQSLMSQGLMKHLSPEETQKLIEQSVFGDTFSGAQKRFVNADLNQTAKSIGEPSAEKLDKVVNKLATLEDQRRMLEVQNNTKDMINGANRLTPGMISQMEAAQAAEQKRETDKISAYSDLRRAADAIDSIVGLFKTVTDQITKVLGYLADLVAFTKKFGMDAVGRKILNSLFGPPPGVGK